MNLTLLASLRRFAFKTGGKQELGKIISYYLSFWDFLGPEIVCTLLLSNKFDVFITVLLLIQ